MVLTHTAVKSATRRCSELARDVPSTLVGVQSQSHTLLHYLITKGGVDNAVISRAEKNSLSQVRSVQCTSPCNRGLRAPLVYGLQCG